MKMTMVKNWLKPKLLLPSLAATAVLAAVGDYIAPLFYSAGTEQRTESSAVLLSAGATLVASVFALFMLSLLFESAKKESGRKRQTKPPGKAFGGILAMTGVFIIAFFLISLLYGLLAVLLNWILKSVMTFEEFKGVFNVVTMILTVAVMPLFFNVLFTYGLGKMKITEGISTGTKTIKIRYVKLLIFLVTAGALGWLAVLPFRYFDSTLILRIIKTTVTVIIGTLGLTFAFSLFAENKPTLPKPKSKIEPTEVSAEKEKELVTV